MPTELDDTVFNDAPRESARIRRRERLKDGINRRLILHHTMI
jgi:hypothetical protein